MKVISALNVNEAAAEGISYLLEHGAEENSRNGKVLVAPGPVCTIYHNPQERVLFSPTRNANPFFHLMEALWMLSGSNDLEYPMWFNKRFKEYSDDGRTVWGAYGWRWRRFFGYDQLNEIVEELRKNPTSRRCVLSMWNAAEEVGCYDNIFETDNDLEIAFRGGKDVPCNTHAYFDCRGGVLNMTVCNRSNDAIWGAYGANAVHFSILQEYLASRIGVPMGVYRQVSNNFHAYLDIYDRDKLKTIATESRYLSSYTSGSPLKVIPLMTEPHDKFMENLVDFIGGERDLTTLQKDDFFSRVALPMSAAWDYHKDNDDENALQIINDMIDCDWKLASRQWLERSMERSNV